MSHAEGLTVRGPRHIAYPRPVARPWGPQSTIGWGGVPTVHDTHVRPPTPPYHEHTRSRRSAHLP